MPTAPPDRSTVTRAEIAADLRGLGVELGDTLLVHSAMSKIGWVEGGARSVVAALLEVLGPDGTLVVPTLPFRGSLTDYFRSDPLFEVESTPSMMGAVTEAVRTHPEAVRSLGPSHPVAAIGPRSGFLIEEQLRSEGPCDRHSPFYRLTEVGGKVLLLGVDFSSCTLLHTCEELARVPFIDFDTRYPVRGRAGGREYSVLLYSHSAPYPARFNAIEAELTARGLLEIGRVGAAECRLFLAADLLNTALELLARNPTLLRSIV